MLAMLRTFLLTQKEIQKASIDCSCHVCSGQKTRSDKHKGDKYVLVVELSSPTLGSNQNDLLKDD